MNLNKIVLTGLFVLVFFAMSFSALAQTKAWLIGGGSELGNSQGQIEENVRWLQSVFGDLGVDTKTYFTRGPGEEDDVIYYTNPEDRIQVLDPLYRVYGKRIDYATVTKQNTLPYVHGTTEKESLSKSLKNDFTDAQPGDSVLLVYNGHGDIDTSNTLNNYLKLWGDTELNISELNDILNHITTEATIRFVLTQCFSGSFSSLVYEYPRSKTLAPQPRCGFMAESDRRESEGCDLGINQEDFRDYTTYFFAALSGRTRLGEPIPFDQVDLDGSGTISYREAHLHTLLSAYSSDLSRSTSEVFVEQWEPWYLRWNPSRAMNPDNVYRKISQHLSEKHDLPTNPLRLFMQHLKMKKEENKIKEQIGRVESRIVDIKNEIKNEIEMLLNIDSTLSVDDVLLLDNYKEISFAIEQLSDYEELKINQNQLEELNNDKLDIVRQKTQLEKHNRVKKIGYLFDRFFTYANSQDSKKLNSIIQCEEGIL